MTLIIPNVRSANLITMAKQQNSNLTKECDCMKKLLLILSIVFIILTFVGAIFVLTSNGTANAGYAVVPLVIALACLAGHRAYKKK